MSNECSLLVVSTIQVVKKVFSCLCEEIPRLSLRAEGEAISTCIARDKLRNLAVKQIKEGKRQLTQCRWGFLPHWAKDEKIAYKMINARAETVAEKPAFREVLQTMFSLIKLIPFDAISLYFYFYLR